MPRHPIDPESLGPLEADLAVLPGGLGSIPDIVERRARAKTLPGARGGGREPAGDHGGPDRPRTTRGARHPRPRLPARRGVGAAARPLRHPRRRDDHGRRRRGGPGGDAVLRRARRRSSSRSSTGWRPSTRTPPVRRTATPAWSGRPPTPTSSASTPSRLAVYGGSAGGGLALAVALMARDRGGPGLCFVMAPYPMVDDRNETPSSRAVTDVGAWDRSTNVEAWGWYLGGREADAYAAPARATDLAGLPADLHRRRHRRPLPRRGHRARAAAPAGRRARPSCTCCRAATTPPRSARPRRRSAGGSGPCAWTPCGGRSPSAPGRTSGRGSRWRRRRGRRPGRR